jgi:hypothetical protein
MLRKRRLESEGMELFHSEITERPDWKPVCFLSGSAMKAFFLRDAAL